MVWEWLKKNKGSPAFKFVILILVLFIIRVSLLAFDLVNNKQDTEQSNTDYQSEQVQSDSDSEDNKSILSYFDIHIGWSNIVVFLGLAAALAIIERRKDKSNEQQKMSGSDNRKDE